MRKQKSKIFKPIRRSWMTLLEVLIAMGLVSIILLALFGIFSQLSMVEIESHKVRKENFRLSYVHSRLADVLPKTMEIKEKNGSFEGTFYTQGSRPPTITSASLVFIYNNGVDLNPTFSNDVIGRLYLNQQNQLCLDTWPSPKRWHKENPPVKHEILLNDVSNLSFSFYVPPKHNEKPVDPKDIQHKKVEPNEGWNNQEWLNDYKQLPAIIKVEIKRNVAHGKVQAGEPIVFVFPLFNTIKKITYKK